MTHRRSMSDGYTHEDLGVTKAEFDRLLRAIDEEIVPAGVAFSKRNISLFQHGGMRVDELIRNWSVRGYKDPFADREIILTERELEDIIHEAAENTQRFVEYRIEGTTVYATFSSNSRKNAWDAVYDFNDNGRITGRFKCEVAYLSAKAPRWFGENIEILVRRLVDEKDYM